MYIAAMTEKPGMEGIVSPLFGNAEYLTIMQAETASVYKVYGREDVGGDCGFARKIVEHDCEAVLCGPVEETPFVILADEGCVTRYLASGLTARKALEEMNWYRLPMLPDFIGGSGCHSGEEGRCLLEDENE